MRIELNQAVRAAGHNLCTVMKGHIGGGELQPLLELLLSVAKVAPLSSAVAKETCQQFLSSCGGIYKCLLDEGRNEPAFGISRIVSEFCDAFVEWYKVAYPTEQIARKDWDRGDVEPVYIARWESKGGRHWVDLWRGRFDYNYKSNDSGGSVCSPYIENSSAVVVMQALVDSGKFLPDSAVIPMKRVL